MGTPHEIHTFENDRSPLPHELEQGGQAGVRWRIDDCLVDIGRRQLLRRGERVRVEPKVFDLIARLVDARGMLVSKKQLYVHMWPETRVTSSSLRRLVKEARRALGDDGRAPRVILTLHGRGYRLGVPVEEVGEEDPA